MDVPQIELKEIQTSNTEIKKTNAELMSPTVVAHTQSPQEVKGTPTPSPQTEKVDPGTLTGKQLAINLMKCIAGTGSLTIPYGMWNEGIILGVVLFIIVAILYVISGYHLVTVYYRSQGVRTDAIKTNNDYARLCYITMGQVGYWIFNIANVITLFGMAMGTMIVMTDFLDSLPIPTSHPTLKRAILQFIITVICLILCILKDPSLLVGVSSFGLIALVVSLLILFFYGVAAYGFKFESSFWFPQRGHVLSNLGVFINSLAFSLMCLSQVKHLKRSYRTTITRTISISVFSMALIYVAIGVIFLMIYKTEDGIADNILRAIPNDSVWNMIISVLMVVTCMGSFPLYLGPIHELFDGRCGAVKAGKYFISTPVYVWLRVVEVCAISVLAFLFDNFRAVLNFNILEACGGGLNRTRKLHGHSRVQYPAGADSSAVLEEELERDVDRH